jgi:hypothetical protein
MKVTGKITKINEIEKGISIRTKKEWQKILFVLETTEEYNNVYPLQIFGEEKVENFLKYNKIGAEVDVDFNVSANEWEGKYFVNLQAWKVFKAEEGVKTAKISSEPEDDDLPF